MIDNGLSLRINRISGVLSDMALSDTQRINKIHGILAACFDGNELILSIIPDHILRQMADKRNAPQEAPKESE